MNKIGLVLEGGGMRGAYTAGALSWLIDNNIEFDYGVAISAGAVHLCSYLLKNKDFLFDISTKYMVDKSNVGLNSFLREGRYVGYDYMFNDLLYNQIKYDITPIIEGNTKSELGVYNCKNGEVMFWGKDEFDKELNFLKATCTLPIAGRIVNYKGFKLLDGGIRCMIPIERSIEVNNDKHFVISTKPKGYVRKEASLFMKIFMFLNYINFPNIYKDYFKRHLRYHQQVDLVENLVKDDKAFFLRPSKKIDVNRFSGEKDQLIELYELGRQDMENNKEEFLKFIGK